MEFFNSKEEVLEIKLTQFGKFLYSKGMFKPVYYSFFDDDILYDGLYGGKTESQNDIESRIQEETPRLKVQTVFESTDSLNKLLTIEKINSNIETNQFINTIGNSNLGEQLSPAWDIQSLFGSFDSISTYFTGSDSQIISIPQINCVVAAEDSVMYLQTNINEAISSGRSDYNQHPNFDFTLENNGIFPDESVINIKVNSLLLKIQEYNADSLYDPFEIEVYETITNPDLSESYKQLKFVTNNNLENEQQSSFDVEINENNVENYFVITTDTEINSDMVCGFILKDRSDVDEIFKDFEICKQPIAQSNGSLYAVNIANISGDNC
jgi:hypothetical protein